MHVAVQKRQYLTNLLRRIITILTKHIHHLILTTKYIDGDLREGKGHKEKYIAHVTEKEKLQRATVLVPS